MDIELITLCLLQIHSLVGEMRSKFRDTVNVLMKVGSSDNGTADADRSHEQQLAEVSKMILVMKVSAPFAACFWTRERVPNGYDHCSSCFCCCYQIF